MGPADIEPTKREKGRNWEIVNKDAKIKIKKKSRSLTDLWAHCRCCPHRDKAIWTFVRCSHPQTHWRNDPAALQALFCLPHFAGPL